MDVSREVAYVFVGNTWGGRGWGGHQRGGRKLARGGRGSGVGVEKETGNLLSRTKGRYG